jgi:hypothetical protein
MFKTRIALLFFTKVASTILHGLLPFFPGLFWRQEEVYCASAMWTADQTSADLLISGRTHIFPRFQKQEKSQLGPPSVCGWRAGCPCGLVQKSATLILLWHSTVYLIRNLTILSLYYNSWNFLVKSKVSTLVHVCAFRGGSSIRTGWARALTIVFF